VETQTRSGGFNWDLLGQTAPDSILEAISSSKPVIAEAYMLPNMSNLEEVEEYEAWKEWFGNIIHPDDVSNAVKRIASRQGFVSLTTDLGSRRASV
jgi:hypothetical protein